MSSEALSGRQAILQEKLDYFLKLGVSTADPEQKFQLKKRIEEIELELDEIELELGELARASPVPWNVPRRNRYFVGREDVLDALDIALRDEGRAAIGQAIAGLGGVGKTQTAVEYCWRHRDAYPGGVFWVRAETETEIRSGFQEVARRLALPEAEVPKQDVAVAAVLRWLSEHDDWLLIFDNVDKPDELERFLPGEIRGRLLLTSRAISFATLGLDPYRLPVLLAEEAQKVLLRRTPLEGLSPDERQAVIELAEELGFLPLALEQAAAYVATRQTSFASYLKSFRQRHLDLLEKKGPETGSYLATVATTWSMSFQDVEQESKATADFLRAVAFLAPDAIPQEIFDKGAAELGAVPVAKDLRDDTEAFSDLVEPLLRRSLVERDIDAKTVSVHRLVQAVTRAELGEQAERSWAERVARALAGVFPPPDFKAWPRCKRLYSQVLEVAGHLERMSIDLKEAALLLNDAGWYAKKRARYEGAERLLLHARTMYERTLGPDHPNVAAVLDNLANLYRAQGRYAKAEPLYDRSLVIYKKAFESDHPDVATTLNNLANLYRDQGRDQEAKSHYESSLKIWEALEPESPAIAPLLNNLAELHRAQGNSQKAIPLYQRSLEISRKTHGADHPHVAVTLTNLYRAQGLEKKLKPLYERLLASQEKALGPDHPTIAKVLNRMAGLYRDQGHYKKAEPLYERSLTVLEEALGVDSPVVATVLNNLALLYRDQGRYKEAEKLCKRALAIREKALGTDHPAVATVLNNLAVLYVIQRRHAEAASLYERSIDIRDRALGPHHPDMAVSLGNLADLYRLQERYAEAESLFKRSLDISEKVLGPGHPKSALTLSNLAELYLSQRRFEEAEPLFQNSLEILEKALGSDHPHVAYPTSGLAVLYWHRGSPEMAEPLFQRSLRLREKALGPDHPLTAQTRRLYADFRQATGRPAAADLPKN